VRQIWDTFTLYFPPDFSTDRTGLISGTLQSISGTLQSISVAVVAVVATVVGLLFALIVGTVGFLPKLVADGSSSGPPRTEGARPRPPPRARAPSRIPVISGISA
jgi:hypothetical protein